MLVIAHTSVAAINATNHIREHIVLNTNVTHYYSTQSSSGCAPHQQHKDEHHHRNPTSVQHHHDNTEITVCAKYKMQPQAYPTQTN